MLVIFTAAALLLFVYGNYEYAFVCAALGAVVWFLRYRAQLKEMIQANTPPERSDESFDPNDEE